MSEMTPDQAAALVREMVAAATEATKAANRGRGWKTHAFRERKAAKALMVALTGAVPTDAELDAICGY